MSRVGVLTFSDGRDFVHQGIAGFVADVEARIIAACEAAGYEVVRGTVPITSNEVAVAEAQQARRPAARPDRFQLPGLGFPSLLGPCRPRHHRPAPAFLQHRPHLPRDGLDAGGRWEPGPARTAPRAALGRHIGAERCPPASASWLRPPTPCASSGRLHICPYRGTIDGHVHGRRAEPTSGCAGLASTSKRSTSGR